MYEAREVQVKSERSRILRSSNRARRDQNGGGEGERYFGLANPKESQECIEVPRISKLLLSIH